MTSLASDVELGIGWSDPVPLTEAVCGAAVPAVAGLYRIRRIGMEGWDYIGQTGSGQMNLRRRMAMLKGIYLDKMPYRDPHTAGPALWALLQSTGAAFEVGFCPVVGRDAMAEGPRSRRHRAPSPALRRVSHGELRTHAVGVLDVVRQ